MVHSFHPAVRICLGSKISNMEFLQFSCSTCQNWVKNWIISVTASQRWTKSATQERYLSSGHENGRLYIEDGTGRVNFVFSLWFTRHHKFGKKMGNSNRRVVLGMKNLPLCLDGEPFLQKFARRFHLPVVVTNLCWQVNQTGKWRNCSLLVARFTRPKYEDGQSCITKPVVRFWLIDLWVPES